LNDMDQNASKSGKRKGSGAKGSKQKSQNKANEPAGLPLSDFFTALAEKSIPADHETDLMLSEAIMKIAQPHIDKYDKKDPHVKTILGLAVAAWNLPLIPKDYYQSATKKIAENIPIGLTLDQTEALLMLVFSMMKSRLYDYRTITDYIYKNEINETEEGWSVRIISTVKIL
jgi:hypothetical protein